MSGLPLLRVPGRRAVSGVGLREAHASQRSPQGEKTGTAVGQDDRKQKEHSDCCRRNAQTLERAQGQNTSPNATC